MASPKNERNTENVVRSRLRRHGYYREASKVVVEEQRSGIDAIQRLLRAASKAGGGGIGAPEFIISCPLTPDFLLIVECKASTADHVSQHLRTSTDPIEDETDADYAKRVQRYAADGVLHYAGYLSREFNVVAVAVSGDTDAAAVVTAYLHPRGAERPKVLATKDGTPVRDIIPWDDYIEHSTFDPTVQRMRAEELMAFSRDLHDFMRDHAKLTESEKPLLVSGTLIALKNKAFAKSYDEHDPGDLQSEWLRVIASEIQRAEIPKAKKDKMVQPYTGIAAHPELGKSTRAYPKGVLHELIRQMNEKVWPFISVYHDFDVVGQFYGEFLKYTGGDKKALGIVLTPRHVTELFAMLANVTKTSRVLDICAGTAGFLISAMHQMMKGAVTERDRERIRKLGLVGVEQQPNMFALAASNMILRGDGKANLYQGSCFEEEIVKAVKEHRCTVGLLNPPFSQEDESQHELAFIHHMLECLQRGSLGVALAPMSCAIAPHPYRHTLLAHHTLEAVVSLPDDLFYPVGTIACAMVFTAKVPHAESNRNTWFGYWKDDGYIKTKHRGRVDPFNRWPGIRDRWVEMFRNRQVHAGESVTRKVSADDEWCAEAYMETDYTRLTRADFEKVVKNYAVYRLIGLPPQTESEASDADGE